MQIGDLLNCLQKVKRLGDGSYMSLCPAHNDRTPSLHVSLKGDNILLSCQAGCSTDDVVKALGIELPDLFITPLETKVKETPAKVVAEYDYKDENGNLLFQVLRMEPKSFRQRHKANNEWVWNLNGIRRVLYHLPELKQVTAESVYLVEGEKDADNLWMWGQIATTSPGGSNAWRDEYSEYLLGKRVVIIPDRDTAGFAYARQAANSLIGKVQELKCIVLPDTAKDISDWLDNGGDCEQLPSMEQDIEVLFASDKPDYHWVGDTVQWDKKVQSLLLTFRAERISSERTGIHARVSIFGQHESLSWSYLNIERREDRSSLAGAAHKALKTEVEYKADDLRHDLDSFCAELWEFHLSQYVPEEMSGDETPSPLSFYLKPYILDGGGTIIFAPPGRGKSYTALLWAVSVDSGTNKFWETSQTRVLYINLERSGDSLRRRLSMVNKLLELSPTRSLLTLNARGRPLSAVAPACIKAIQRHNVGMVVLDSISRAGLGDLTENLSGNRVIDTLSSLCPTWLALGHTSRASEEHIYGSIMQDAGADISIQLSSQIKDDGTLGTGLQITKQNDIGIYGQKIYAFEFEENELVNFRQAKPYEFSNIEGKSKLDMMTAIIEYITNQDSGDATATEITNEFGFDRSNVSRLFSKSGKFVQTRKVKHSTYYGVKGESVY